MRGIIVSAVLASLMLIGAGCGKPTAEGVAKEFVSLMQAGKFAEAAELWDLQAEGRAQNPDWDTFGESQRKLIIQKDLAPKKAALLQQWATAMPAGTKVASVTESGTTAQAALEGGQLRALQLVKVGESWKIAGMQ
ncbi:MAG: hypothetical protein HPY69_00385 [Armatimonadetes bacterium]|nr:hypothetical protein [Armatimonadota bacterium]